MAMNTVQPLPAPDLRRIFGRLKIRTNQVGFCTQYTRDPGYNSQMVPMRRFESILFVEPPLFASIYSNA